MAIASMPPMQERLLWRQRSSTYVPKPTIYDKFPLVPDPDPQQCLNLSSWGFYSVSQYILKQRPLWGGGGVRIHQKQKTRRKNKEREADMDYAVHLQRPRLFRLFLPRLLGATAPTVLPPGRPTQAPSAAEFISKDRSNLRKFPLLLREDAIAH